MHFTTTQYPSEVIKTNFVDDIALIKSNYKINKFFCLFVSADIATCLGQMLHFIAETINSIFNSNRIKTKSLFAFYELLVNCIDF